MFGFLNVYKPKGKTSHDVVAILRRVTKVKQIGHTGTLDPFAEGVLPICIGKATRLIEYLGNDKAYIGTIQLGQATDTYDIDGKVTKTSNKEVTLDDIERTLENFRGDIEQIPPIYSAIKVNGKKLYDYARSGQDVDIQPRKVHIEELRIQNFNKITNRLELYVACSKGTYIRSIANDLGVKLGTFGHLIKLIRVKAGKFELESSVNLNVLNSVEDVNNYLINPIEYLDYDRYELNSDELKKVINGMSIYLNDCNISFKSNYVILTFNNNLTAIGQIFEREIKCKKVLINPILKEADQ